MKKRAIKRLMIVLAIVFMASNIVLGHAIFKTTVRENAPDYCRSGGGMVIATDLAGTGDAYVFGEGNTVWYQYTHFPTPSRSYDLSSVVRDVVISDNAKYVAAADAQGTLYLFSFGAGPELRLLYSFIPGENASIGGLVVLGQKSNIARLVAYTERSISVHSDTFADALWAWDFQEDITCVSVSHYGDVTAVGTDENTLSFFRTFSATLSWQTTCDSAITSISVSPFANYAVVGTESGSVYLYDIAAKTLLWKIGLPSPIVHTDIRSSATESLVLDAAGTLVLLDRAGTRLNEISGAGWAYLPYWSEGFAYTVQNALFVQREGRSVPDWSYSLGMQVHGMDANYGFSTLMVTTSDAVLFFFEDDLFIYGSRTYWSLLALIVVGQVLVLGYLAYLQKGTLYSIMQNKEFIEFFIGVVGGLALSLLLARSAGTYNAMNIIIGSAACGLSAWQCSRLRGGFVGAFAGYVVGFFGSIAIGAAFGVYRWLGGAEQNIVSSLFGSAFVGGLLGAVFSVIGVVIGLVIKGYLEEYRQRKAQKV